MQSIHLPDDQYQKLTGVVQAAGFADVHAFLDSMTDEAIEDPRGELSEEEMTESVARIRRGDAEIDAGGGMSAEDAFRHLGEKHGFELP